MKSRTCLLLTSGLVSLACGIGLGVGCSAGGGGSAFPEGGSSATTSHTGGGGAGAASGGGGQGGILFGGAGGNGGSGGIPIDPCATECGPVELCDGIHAGLDDNCNGIVDEGCPCSTGMVEPCFKGDPGHRNDPGCFPGTQHCTEFGLWGDCIGGVHAVPPDNCWEGNAGCHAITTYPFVTVNLKDGTGDFSNDAISESWTVDCPPGISPCPPVTGANPADDYQPLQSGEYTVHYAKVTANGSDTCDYPLFVGAPGLRVELDWEHGVQGPSDMGVDLDLHMHKPQDTTAWAARTGNEVDCAYSNCVIEQWSPFPTWFNGAAPPDPMNWYLDPVLEKNTCYFAPRGKGQLWQDNGQGCHNPRLDLDNITCNPTSVDVNSTDFCAPENINIDYPPKSQWIRIGVDYYSAHGVTYDVHPRVRIFCNAALMAELGPQGYDLPVTFTAADGSGYSNGNRFWMVADVRFGNDQCADKICEVQTLYMDPALHTALLTTETMAQASYGPPYPP